MERLDRRDLLAADGFALSFGTSLNPFRVDDVGDAIAVDNAGDLYVASTDRAGLDDGWERVDVDKYSADGELIWKYQRGSRGDIFSSGIAVAEDGGVFVTGAFKNTIQFDFSIINSIRKSAGSFDFYVLKLTPEGRYESVLTFGQSGGAWDRARDIAVDPDGNVVVTGYFGGKMDFDPDPNRELMLSANGSNEMFVMKLTAGGDLLWAKAIGGDRSEGGTNEIESAETVATDSDGNIYVGGYFVGEADFDRDASYPDNRDRLTARGTWDGFLAKYDASGGLQWVRQMGATGTNYDAVLGVAVDGQDNPIVTGTFRGNDFDPGDGSSVASTNNGFDVLVSKFDPAGNLSWSQHIGDTGDDRGRAVAVDGSGLVHVGGFFNGIVDFDPSDSGETLLYSGNPGFVQAGTGFLLTLDASGNFVSVGRHGGSGRDVVTDVAADVAGNAYMTGFFENTATFDVGSETVELTSHGGKDVFVAKVVRTTVEPIAEIRGAKWNDRNGNGEWDENEPGIPGWTIYADLNENGQLDENEPFAVTREDDPDTAEVETGTYSLIVAPGTYVIAEVDRADWRQTFPARGTTVARHEALMGYGLGGVAVHASLVDQSDIEPTDTALQYDEVESESFVVDGRKWPQPDGLGTPIVITYSYSNLLDGGLGGTLTESELRAATEEALALWATYAPLEFREVSDTGPAPSDTNYPADNHPDIRIGHHFIDGSGSTLAHAYLPFSSTDGRAGDTHVDSGEVWRLDPSLSGIDILQVMVHEIGHSLGLGHEPLALAIMNGSYRSRYVGLGSAFLFPDDIAGIQAIYGERTIEGSGTWIVSVAADEQATEVDFGNQAIPQMRVRLEARDLDGNPVTSVGLLDDFRVAAIVSDLRTDAGGVYASFLDVNFDADQFRLVGDVDFGESYPNGRRFGLSAGRLDDIGAVADFDSLGQGEFVLFSIPFEARELGSSVIAVDAADLFPEHDSLLFGRNQPVPVDNIEFVSTLIEVTAPVNTTYETTEDATIRIVGSPHDTLQIAGTQSISSSGAAILLEADGILRYDPAPSSELQALRAGEALVDTFQYTLRNARNTEHVVSVTVTVYGENEAPVVAQPITSKAVLVTESSTISLSNVFQGESGPFTLDVLLTNGASLPNWLTFDGSILTAKPELSDVGSWDVTLTASHPISAQAAATTFTIVVDNPFQNEQQPLDVNGDGVVAPIDVLLVINDLNTNSARALLVSDANQLSAAIDVNGDLRLTPIDALLVINHLNSNAVTSAEGEGGSLPLVSPPVANINVHELEFTSVASERVFFLQGSSPTATPFGPQAKLQPRDMTGVVKWPADDLLTDSELEDILDCIVTDMFEANTLA